jgi:hypothetical protein
LERWVNRLLYEDDTPELRRDKLLKPSAHCRCDHSKCNDQPLPAGGLVARAGDDTLERILTGFLLETKSMMHKENGKYGTSYHEGGNASKAKFVPKQYA